MTHFDQCRVGFLVPQKMSLNTKAVEVNIGVLEPSGLGQVSLEHEHYGVVPKGLLTFLGFFMQCGIYSLLGTSGIHPGTYSLRLLAGLFSDAMGYCLSMISCEMTRTK